MTQRFSFGRCTYLCSELIKSDQDQAYYDRYFDPEYLKVNARDLRVQGGRGSTYLYRLDGQNLVTRHYRRGGLFGKIVKDRFFKWETQCRRAQEEFWLLSYMLAQGLPVPAPVLARQRDGFLSCVNDIVITALEGCSDLAAIMRERELTDEEFCSIGQTVRVFFEAGILHTDLNIRNILLDGTGKVYLIDFDKCTKKSMDKAVREQVTARLCRSFLKEQRLYGLKVHFDSAKLILLRKKALG